MNPMQDEFLTRCVVDPVGRTFRLISSEGDERVVDCETVDQFMSCLLYTSPSPRDRTRSRMPSSA